MHPIARHIATKNLEYIQLRQEMKSISFKTETGKDLERVKIFILHLALNMVQLIPTKQAVLQ